MVWVAEWACKGWYWIANVVCHGWTYLIVAVCILWSFVAKGFCVLWGTVVCAVTGALRAVSGSTTTPGGAQIKHVFVLMLENRSFDHMLGFSKLAGTDAVSGVATRVDDLVGNPQANFDFADSPLAPIFADTPADYAIASADKDPDHEFEGVLEQLAGPYAVYPDPLTNTYPAVDNSGFIASYRDWSLSPSPKNIMRCYAPEQLPVLNALASEFAICDRWFSSMPGPTWPNRFFVHAGSSGGLDDSPSAAQTAIAEAIDGYRFEHGTIFDLLDDRCLDWEIFEGDEFPQSFAISGMNLHALEGHFTDFEEFKSEIQSPGYSAKYVFIEPNYGNILPHTAADFTCGNSQHPLDDVTRGERLIKDVYEALRNSSIWDSSVLLVTYDEHGGFFDHVRPPRAVAPGDAISDPDNSHHGFDFRQLGVRVPTVIVSPLIPRGTIDHTVYDHTSLLATVEKLFHLPSLTARDRVARNFMHLFSLSAPRKDAPTSLPEPAASGLVCADDDGLVGIAATPMTSAQPATTQPEKISARGQRTPVMTKPDRATDRAGDAGALSGSLRGFLLIAVRKHLSTFGRGNRREQRRIVRRFMNIKTAHEARQYIHDVRQLVRSERQSLDRRPQRHLVAKP